MKTNRNNAAVTAGQEHRPTQPLPRRTPGAHRFDELGQPSTFVYDEHDAWSPEALRAAGDFFERREQQ